MRRNLEDRDIKWRVIEGVLERRVTLPSGKSYRHRCSKDAFELVAFYLADHPNEGVTMNIIADALDLPFTQVNVAMELLKERSILETDGRKSYVGAGYRDAVHLDAMTEYYALAEGCPPQIRAADEAAKEDEPNQ